MKRSMQVVIGAAFVIIGVIGGRLIFQTGNRQIPAQAQAAAVEPVQSMAPAADNQAAQPEPAPVIRLEHQARTQMAQTEESDSRRTVSVSGQGQVDAQPDVAVVRLGVQTQAESAAEALNENSRRMQALIDTLKNAGIPAEDIQTQSLRLQPRFEQAREPNALPRIAGYTAANTVQAQVRNLDLLGQLLDDAINAGGNTIEGIRFEVSEPAQVLDQAREAAMLDAKNKAEQLAMLADAQLGDVLTINEGSQPPRPIGVQRVAVAEAAAPVPIEPGSQSIQVNVQVTWLLR